MKSLRNSLCALVLVSFLLGTLACAQQVNEGEKGTTALDQSAELAKEYLNAFKKSGTPTPKAVDAAFEKARSSGAVEDWTLAAEIANSYANVIDVLSKHWYGLYLNSGERNCGGPLG